MNPLLGHLFAIDERGRWICEHGCCDATRRSKRLMTEEGQSQTNRALGDIAAAVGAPRLSGDVSFLDQLNAIARSLGAEEHEPGVAPDITRLDAALRKQAEAVAATLGARVVHDLTFDEQVCEIALCLGLSVEPVPDVEDARPTEPVEVEPARFVRKYSARISTLFRDRNWRIARVVEEDVVVEEWEPARTSGTAYAPKEDAMAE